MWLWSKEQRPIGRLHPGLSAKGGLAASLQDGAVVMKGLSDVHEMSFTLIRETTAAPPPPKPPPVLPFISVTRGLRRH